MVALGLLWRQGWERTALLCKDQDEVLGYGSMLHEFKCEHWWEILVTPIPCCLTDIFSTLICMRPPGGLLRIARCLIQ